MRALVPVLLVAVCLSSSVRGVESAEGEGKTHPLAHDKTGVSWVYPFATAKKRAADEKRLLVIKDEPVIEAVADKGIGVFETLKALARLVLQDLTRSGDSPSSSPRPVPPVP